MVSRSCSIAKADFSAFPESATTCASCLLRATPGPRRRSICLCIELSASWALWWRPLAGLMAWFSRPGSASTRLRSAGVYAREPPGLGLSSIQRPTSAEQNEFPLKEVALPFGRSRPTKSAQSRVKRSRCSELTLRIVHPGPRGFVILPRRSRNDRCATKLIPAKHLVCIEDVGPVHSIYVAP